MGCKLMPERKGFADAHDFMRFSNEQALLVRDPFGQTDWRGLSPVRRAMWIGGIGTE
jgi:hypothetical protein